MRLQSLGFGVGLRVHVYGIGGLLRFRVWESSSRFNLAAMSEGCCMP